MANKEKIALLSKYQMKVLYYKCKEGATHEEIAILLDRDVNTIQYHMTKIYKILEIKGPGKSKEAMDSELKNEVCPLIRQMFNSFEDIKTWAPSQTEKLGGDQEYLDGDKNAPELEESRLAYQPPPSVEKILKQTEDQPAAPQILEAPPPGIRRINWRWLIGLALIGMVLFAGWRIYPRSGLFQKLASAPTPSIPTEAVLSLIPTEAPTSVSIIPTLPTYPAVPSASAPPLPAASEIVTQTATKDNMVLVYIPAGEFKMGSARADDPQTLEEELPQHSVYLDAYWIDQTEVTNRQYALCVADAGACTLPANNSSLSRSSYYDNSQYADYPVVYVSWSQAAAYCAWAGRRLPTEAEWEKAARGPDGRIYPWGNTFDGRLANYCDINCVNGWRDSQFDDGYIDTAPVGEYPEGASVYGALDMAGNVYEWVADWYGPYSRIAQSNPTGPASGQEHIIRGGSWGDDSAHIRVAIRSHVSSADYWMNFIGFRCVR